jgi:methyltransferase (TIGR00027 family)
MATRPDDSLGEVGATALGAAEMRAEESGRSDRLFDDPYAAAFVAAAPPLFPELDSIADDPEIARLKTAFSSDIVVRTRFFDEHLSTACRTGCDQVVILGAGLDTRAFRLDWPDGVHLFEVDLPEVLAFKEHVLTQERAVPRCLRTTVGSDLRADWLSCLARNGFAPESRTAWLAEGLLAYLSNDEAVRLLDAIGHLSAVGSELSFEHDEFAGDATLVRARAAPALRQVTSMWQGGLTAYAPDWLRAHHWNVRSYDRSRLAREYARATPDHSTARFLIATRRETA